MSFGCYSVDENGRLVSVPREEVMKIAEEMEKELKPQFVWVENAQGKMVKTPVDKLSETSANLHRASVHRKLLDDACFRFILGDALYKKPHKGAEFCVSNDVNILHNPDPKNFPVPPEDGEKAMDLFISQLETAVRKFNELAGPRKDGRYRIMGLTVQRCSGTFIDMNGREVREISYNINIRGVGDKTQWAIAKFFANYFHQSYVLVHPNIYKNGKVKSDGGYMLYSDMVDSSYKNERYNPSYKPSYGGSPSKPMKQMIDPDWLSKFEIPKED